MYNLYLLQLQHLQIHYYQIEVRDAGIRIFVNKPKNCRNQCYIILYRFVTTTLLFVQLLNTWKIKFRRLLGRCTNECVVVKNLYKWYHIDCDNFWANSSNITKRGCWNNVTLAHTLRNLIFRVLGGCTNESVMVTNLYK